MKLGHSAATVKTLRPLTAVIGIAWITVGAVAESQTQALRQHTVIVRFSYAATELSPLFNFRTKLEEAIGKANAGEVAGDAINVDGNEVYLYMYGADGDRLYEVIEPLLLDTPLVRGATVKIRYGPLADDVREREILIS